MIVRFNFGPESSFVPNGYISDFGEAYSESNGYGWITQASVDEDTVVPLSIVGNARERSLPDDQLVDTLIHLQYPAIFDNPTSVTTPAAWEYEVENGRYRVTVGVGDPAFTDSIHAINLENINAISGFVPTENDLFREATRIVEVTDGRLTLDAVGGENTKLNFVEIAPVTEVRINFGLEDSDVPLEYFRDFGQAYSEIRGYGWITQDSIGQVNPIPLNVSANARDRGAISDNLMDTLIHMEYPEALNTSDAVTTPVAWEYAIPNGTYEVTISVGDAVFTDSTHVINLEGEEAFSFTPTEEEKFFVATETVAVSDGKLTVDSMGGDNTKINYIEINPAIDSDIVDVTVNFGAPDSPTPDDTILDIGQAYDSSRGYGWIEQGTSGAEAIPLSLIENGRDRDTLDDRLLDSFVHMQYPEGISNPSAVDTPGAWEYDLPNGEYRVTVSVGDALFVDSNHAINIEGVSVISDFTPVSANDLFRVGTQIVEVNDGKLTIDAIGGTNTKLNYVEIQSIMDETLESSSDFI
ncbi:MAG TPA: hypothetical protein ACFCUY_15900 [Xenococcaceae cyanobacterium]